MTKEEMRIGLEQGRQLTQEEWAAKSEIAAVEELRSEGIVIVTPWKYKDNFQCQPHPMTPCAE
jgi:hypothetical protein